MIARALSRVFAPGIRTVEETPTERKDRLHASVHFWIWEALKSNEAGDFDETISFLNSALEKARTLRKHSTGRDA